MNQVLHFPTTKWSVVIAAQGAPSRARKALQRLAETYWYPVYALIRDSTSQVAEAEALTQGFFMGLLVEGLPADVPPKLRFRAFLMESSSQYLLLEPHPSHGRKRTFGAPSIALDFVLADRRYRLEGTTGMTPEARFECRWARTALDAAEEKLRQKYAATGKAIHFEAIRPYLTAVEMSSLLDVAVDLDMSEEALVLAVQRARRRLGRLLLEEVAQTVHAPRTDLKAWEFDVADEVGYLSGILGISSGPWPNSLASRTASGSFP